MKENEIGLKYKTRGNSIQNKSRIYFSSTSEDFDKYFEEISEDILNISNSVIYYKANNSISSKDILEDLSEINLFIIIVTKKFLEDECDARSIELKYAIDNNIPILPIIMELEIETYFNQKCGNLHALNKTVDIDEQYKMKLSNYLNSILVSDELRKQVQEAFDAYIFLSYRKKDRKHAKQIMHLIHKNEFCRDIAIWYDEFLKPGQDFNESIDEALKKSKLFAMVVTPNLVNEENYVQKIEYPNAKKEGKSIVPIEAIDTSKEELVKKYKEIPTPIKVKDTEVLSESLKKYLISEAWKENSDPKHLYFMGLAYLNGIDVEIDNDKALKLLQESANLNCTSAILELITMYINGKGTKISYEDAIFWQNKLYEKCIRILGENDIHTLGALDKLASFYNLNGEYEKALELEEKSYNKIREIYGDEDKYVLTSLSNLSQAYSSNNKNDKAIELGEIVYDKRKQLLGEDNVETLDSLSNLAYYYTKSENFVKGLELFKLVYEKYNKVLGYKNSKTMDALSNLATCYSYNNNDEKAIEYDTIAYNNLVEILGANHPSTLLTLSNLASHYNSNGNLEKALELGIQAYQSMNEILGENNQTTILTLNNLIWYYSQNGDYNNALKYCKILYVKRKETLGENNEKTLKSLKQLVEYSKKTGNMKDYEKFFSILNKYK